MSEKKNKAIFLDRDGVLIEDNWYIEKVEDVNFFPYTFEALKKVKEEYELYIVTNQSGIGKGLISAEGVREINQYILDEFEKQGINIKKLYCCPHKNEDQCQCKKPNPFFIYEAARESDLDLEKSFVIGDHPSDIQFAENAGAKGLYVLSGHGRKHLTELDNKELVFDSLKEATQWIMTEDSSDI